MSVLENEESEEFLEYWIEEKLEEGISRERLKKILRERDRDPTVVDRVDSPFEDGEEPEDTDETDKYRGFPGLDDKEDEEKEESDEEEEDGRSIRSRFF